MERYPTLEPAIGPSVSVVYQQMCWDRYYYHWDHLSHRIFGSLPYDVRLRVFQYYTDIEESPLLLSLVSLEWQQFVIASPELWKCVVIDMDSDLADAAELITAHFELSKASPVRVCLKGTLDVELVTMLLMPAKGRIQEIEIDYVHGVNWKFDMLTSIGRKLLEINTNIFGSEDTRTLISLYNLRAGDLCQSWARGVPWKTSQLTDFVERLCSHSPAIEQAYRSPHISDSNEHFLAVWEALRQWALAISVKDPSVAHWQKTLARTFNDIRTFPAHIATDTLKRYETIYGEDHPKTLTVLYENGRMRLRGDPPKAAELLSLCMVKREQVLGYRHPDTLTAMWELITAYEGQAFYPEAKSVAERLLGVQRSFLKEDHSEISKTRIKLARLKATLEERTRVRNVRPKSESKWASWARYLSRGG